MTTAPGDIVQQPDLFRKVGKPSRVPMTPNADGLFTYDQVAVLASKRGCRTKLIDDYACAVTYYGGGDGAPPGFQEERIMVTAPGLWAPVDVLAACRKASRCRFFEVDLRKAKVRNPGGLDEVRIARIIGADGIRPYLSRQSQYRVDACGTKVQRPVDGDIRALQGRGWTPRPELSLFKARAGDWTWVMFRVMSIKDGVVPRTSNSNYDFNRCLCTLQDTGLLTTALGKRATASHHWLPLAYLPARSESAPVLDYEDNLAVDEIASGTI